ncbi:MAG: hypothetical protein Q9183_000677 [Haloplaca sp. 2 TL-2023]
MSSKPPPTPTTPHMPSTPSSTSPTLVNDDKRNNENGHLTLQFRRKLNHLSTPLAPLLSVTSGTSHPAFPTTLLHYHLLTSEQLDDLAHHYHQRTPSEYSLFYPLPVVGRWSVPPSGSAQQQQQQEGTREVGIEDKRRRFGRFVGLRGCESPVGVGSSEGGDAEQRAMELWVLSQIRMREAKAEAEIMSGRKGYW